MAAAKRHGKTSGTRPRAPARAGKARAKPHGSPTFARGRRAAVGIKTERELRATREQMSLELRRMTRLHEASARLGGPGDLQVHLAEILDAALEITGADMGLIQRLDETNVLVIGVHAGLEPSFLEFFARVETHVDCACGIVMTTRQRLVLEDITHGTVFTGASLDAALKAGVRALQSTPLFDRSGAFLGVLTTHYRARHTFEDTELRWVDLLARHAGDVIHRGQTETLLARATQDLERRVADRTKWLTLMHDVTRAINDAPTWDEGLRLVLRRICETEHWQMGYVYLPDRDDPTTIVPRISWFGDERFRPFHLVTERCRFTRGQSVPGRVFARGSPLWIGGVHTLLTAFPVRGAVAREVGLQTVLALPVRAGQDIIAVLELLSDQAHAPNPVLANLMNDIGTQIGKVLEREDATAQMADLVWREQQGLLHTLHDSLGQTLTGIGMLASGLGQRDLDPASLDSALQLARLAQLALEEVRQLSRGLFPLEVDATGLMPALRELASTTETFHRVRVRVVGQDPAPVRDGRVATQLYRIAQEAVTNVVKHARAETIRIEMRTASGTTRLRVIDDGVGMEGARSKDDGLGLRIMKYRAASIGAVLAIEPAPGGGTIVTCTQRGSSAVPGERS
jgi:signal transduction histidine kinase